MRKPFTLIESLVITGIIAILAAILYPVFAQAKEAAKKTLSWENQEQLRLANALYVSDYDDFLDSDPTALICLLISLIRILACYFEEELPKAIEFSWLLQSKPTPIFTNQYQLGFQNA